MHARHWCSEVEHYHFGEVRRVLYLGMKLVMGVPKAETVRRGVLAHEIWLHNFIHFCFLVSAIIVKRMSPFSVQFFVLAVGIFFLCVCMWAWRKGHARAMISSI